MGLRLSFDTGGTFTDLALLDPDSGTLHTWKTPTTPDEPSLGVAAGVEQLLHAASANATEIRDAIRGATTLVTNALLERNGALVGLVTTAGFADIIEIGREWRYDIYDLSIRFPSPLVAIEHRFEVRERVLADGSIAEPLNVADLETVARAVEKNGLEALAICFLHSYRNDVHECQAATWLRERLPGIAVISSAEGGVGEIREYERFSTATASAYVAPVVQRHLRKLQESVSGQGIDGETFLMHSAGGLMHSQNASAQPHRLLESGPAAGAIGAAFIARSLGEDRVVAFDMGGTTAKICIIDGGAPSIASQFEAARVHRFKKGSGIPIVSPGIELLEIGAGGGSLAGVDPLGLLKVGPASAGAVPGPACYQRGGKGATVTDADLCLGYLSASAFLGGRMALSVAAAEEAITRCVAKPLGTEARDAAIGINRVVNENMAIAARVHLLEKGRDPRNYSLLSFGGAGPTHCRDIAARIGMRRVICPMSAGVLSALGLQAARATVDFARSDDSLLHEVDWPAVRTMFDRMAEEATAVLLEMGVERVEFRPSADMRYLGQGYEISVPIKGDMNDAGIASSLEARFYEIYKELFAVEARTGEDLEVLRWRLQASDADLPPSHFSSPNIVERATDLASACTARREIYDQVLKDFVSAPVYDHYSLPIDLWFGGPATVEQRESTAIIYTGDQARIDGRGNLIIELPE